MARQEPHSGKRKRREKVPPEEKLEADRLERYQRLLYQSKKALHKEAKIVKSFACQKLVRKLKEAAPSETLEERLARTKAYSINHVVHLSLKRLGIYNLNPEANQPPDANLDAAEQDFVEKCLTHKRMVSAMEAWNEKVTEYRRWYLRRQERISETPDFEAHNTKKTPKKGRENQQRRGGDNGGGLFVNLGGVQHYQDVDEHDLDYPGGEEDFSAVIKKKNRPGQRARKAKALAMKARKEGRTWDKSINWREKKADEDDNQKPRPKLSQKAPKPREASQKAPNSDETVHPSWAARQSQKTGIVEFTGKKITFA